MWATPEWWTWELEFSPHLLKRMIDRAFNEADLRAMFDDVYGYRPDQEEGRWVLSTQWHGRKWEIIVEPVRSERLLVVVTAYPVDGPSVGV